MTLKDDLEADLHVAMKSKSTVVVSTLRMLLTALKQEEVSGKTAVVLSDDAVIKVIMRESKKRAEAAQIYKKASRDELAEVEVNEKAILDAYLPVQLTDSELKELIAVAIADTKATGLKGIGLVMKELSTKTAGRVDGKRLSNAVRNALLSTAE